ncbi:hypothetical protein EVA_07002 [gut metagenome]|uniref:Uncharacterized protein n=1 Tax=gut metagenome TaxID=749906 RepID=J9CXA3_9ZZZZ
MEAVAPLIRLRRFADAVDRLIPFIANFSLSKSIWYSGM